MITYRKKLRNACMPWGFLKKLGVNREGILKVYLITIRPKLEYGVQVWQDIPEFLSNKLESIPKRALYIIYPCHSCLDALNTTLPTLAAWKKDKLSPAVNIFRRWLKMTTPLTSLSREQQLVVIVTTCGPATTVELLFTLIGVVAGPSVQVPWFHSLVNMWMCK